MSEHTSNTTSGPDGEEWERAVGAARTLLSSDCGWLELFTRAILEEKGVPYGKGLPNPEAPHIPEDKEIEEETMPGQGEPTPTCSFFLEECREPNTLPVTNHSSTS